MIHPSCLAMLATVQSAFAREIVPRLTDVEGRSTAATIEHLLRHIALRIEREGGLINADLARLRALLADAAEWMAAEALAAPGLDPAALRALLAAEAAAATGPWRNLDELGAAALTLRAALVEVQGLIAGRQADPAAQALRDRIRAYIGQQLADEATLIEPAFSGKGPRR